MQVTVVGGSMRPGLPPGARVRVDTEDRAARAGRVMLFRGAAGWIVHRVVAVDADRVAHAGDASWRFGVASTDDVAGLVVESVGPLPGRVLGIDDLPRTWRARYRWTSLSAALALGLRAAIRRARPRAARPTEPSGDATPSGTPARR